MLDTVLGGLYFDLLFQMLYVPRKTSLWKRLELWWPFATGPAIALSLFDSESHILVAMAAAAVTATLLHQQQLSYGLPHK